MTNIIEIQTEIKQELSKPEVLKALVETTFKGLETKQIYLAAQEGMMRGFQFKDFLEKNVYAIPFRGGYSLVTSIDYARKLGMRGGVVGVSEPNYEEKDGKIVSCTVTVKRLVEGHVGEYSAKVYFDEYSTGRNLWATKPRTMLAKVAEMHALRKACPEELSKMYTAEEMEQSEPVRETQAIEAPKVDYSAKLASAKSLDELKKLWASLPIEAKKALESLKADLKLKFENENEHAAA